MGNLHFVTQLKPQVHIDGAALLVREDATEQARRCFTQVETSYIEWKDSHHAFSINNINIKSSYFRAISAQRAFIIIVGGGKWGYDEALYEALEALAPYLEDALICIDDEYGTGIQELSIHQGEFTHRNLFGTCDTLLEYIRLTRPQDTQLLLSYCLAQVRDLLEAEGSEFDLMEEWEYAYIRALLKQITDIDARHSEGHVLGARYHYLKREFTQALSYIDKAIGLKEREVKARHWGTNDELTAFENDEDGDIATWFRAGHDLRGLILWRGGKPREALENFRQAQRFTPTFDTRLLRNREAVMLLSLGEYEQCKAILNSLIDTAAKVEDLARGYYNRACLHARTEDIPAAREDLKLAVTLDADYRTRYREDTDLAPLHHEIF